MADSEELVALRSTTEKYLKELQHNFLMDQNKSYILEFVSGVKIYITAFEVPEVMTGLQIRAFINMGATIDANLTRYIAEQNGKVMFGKLALYPEQQVICFEHALLGDYLNRKELDMAIRFVALFADQYDDEIMNRWGGKKKVA